MANARFVSLTAAVEIVSQREGAPVVRSTLSRYVKRYADALNPRSEGRETLVDVERLLKHRSQNINIERGNAQPFDTAKSTAQSRDRKAAADASLSEIELQREHIALAREQGRLTSTAQVEEAAREAIAMMDEALDRAEADIADEIARKTQTEPRFIRPSLRRFKADAKAAFRDSLLKALVPLPVD